MREKYLQFNRKLQLLQNLFKMDELKIENPEEDFSSEMSWFGGEDSPSKSCKEDEFIIVPSKDGPNGFRCKLCEVF